MKEHLKLYDEKMTKTLGALNHEFSAIRAGRANPAVLDKVQVDYYGVPTAINAMAAVTVSEGSVNTAFLFSPSSVNSS